MSETKAGTVVATPPARIWLERREIYGINVWIESTSDGIEFVPAVATQTQLVELREAVRGAFALLKIDQRLRSVDEEVEMANKLYAVLKDSQEES
jgi:hypothetical protein